MATSSTRTTTDKDETKTKDKPDENDDDTLTLLTYNVGLLRFRICCGCLTAFSNPPYVPQRLPYIPAALRRYPADVVALQECYEAAHAEYLCTELQDLYPYHARIDSGGFIKYHNGLLILSKHPVVKSMLQPYEKVASLEKHLATKSNLIVELQLSSSSSKNSYNNNNLQRLTLVNMHTTAGGAVDPENPNTDADRQDELRQAAEACRRPAAAAAAAADSSNSTLGSIIIGDLNCGPEASKDNFDYILAQGFRDTYAEVVAKDNNQKAEIFTWDPQNYLNQVGPHRNSPGQRCDHVLLAKETAMDDWVVEKAEVVLDEPVVDIRGQQKKSTLSDHYGLLVVLKKKKKKE